MKRVTTLKYIDNIWVLSFIEDEEEKQFTYDEVSKMMTLDIPASYRKANGRDFNNIMSYKNKSFTPEQIKNELSNYTLNYCPKEWDGGR